MKRTFLLALVLLGLVAAAASVQAVAENEEMAEDEYLTKADAFLKSLIDNELFLMEMQELIDAVDAGDEGLIILDVRPVGYDEAHIPGSINVPFTELVPDMEMVPADKKIAVVCTFDASSVFSVSVLRIFGDRDAWVVVNGIPGWLEAGRELVASEM
ncbi:MAG: Rhodanese-like domain protein [Methanothrix sp.]|jgi:rhodanese-related sulfurtransferase|nr:MAG: Rhodanese-like domain protein [Methanothrix sp.]